MKKNSRPLFSVIVSCYNPKKYLAYLLDTLTHQGIRKDEYEIIISDDCSTEDYNDILDKYKRKLNIRYIQSDHNYGAPAHTRQQGVEIAKGEWIIFSDQDDGFFVNSFKQVKKYIKKNNSYYVIKTGVYRGLLDTRTTIEPHPCFLTHGLFINKDNVWDKYELKYDYDKMSLAEDTQIVVELDCLRHHKDIKIDDISDKLYTYCWFINYDSLSNNVNTVFDTGIDRQNMEKAVYMYASVHFKVHQKYYNMGYIDDQLYCVRLLEEIEMLYAGFLIYNFTNSIQHIENNKENYKLCKTIIKELDKFMVDGDIIGWLYNPEYVKNFSTIMYGFTRQLDGTSILPFPTISIEDFILMMRNYRTYKKMS